MKKLSIDELKINKDFIEINLNNITVVFSTAENNRSFNRHTKDGVENLNSIKSEYNLVDVAYLNQVHSDNCYIYEDVDNDIKDEEGDAIITSEKNIAVGVFTADCIPIIIANEEKGVVAAIHSGWKGTYSSIVLKTLKNMRSNFDIDISKTMVYIGPHIRKCCYEVSEELKEKFLGKTKINEDILFDDRNLSLEECILKDIRHQGIEEDNIYSLDFCTYCERNLKLHSYRGSVGSYGRLFSFAFIK